MGNADWALVWVGILTLLAMVFGFWQTYKNAKEKELQDARVRAWEQYQEEGKRIRAEIIARVETLFKLHDADAERLVQLELKIARSHYEKPEVNEMLNDLKDTLQHGFDAMGDRFDALAKVMADHLSMNHKGGQ